MVFNPFKMAVQFFQTASNFPNFDSQNAFSPPIQQAPGPDFRKIRKSLINRRQQKHGKLPSMQRIRDKRMCPNIRGNKKTFKGV